MCGPKSYHAACSITAGCLVASPSAPLGAEAMLSSPSSLMLESSPTVSRSVWSCWSALRVSPGLRVGTGTFLM